MSDRLQRVAAVLRLELRIQRREPLTLLYMLVFIALGAAFAAAGPVELVRDRGAVPRDAAWSIMLASTALTAFGQVITTMVAATVVLRDRADRVADLIAATQLTSREYLAGKLIAALVMLGLIYSAVPLGLVLGAVVGGGEFVSAVRAVVPPFVLLAMPTMLAIGALQFAVGVSSGRLWVIVGQGLLLIWLWSAAVDAVAAKAAGATFLLVDPFGSAPLLAATQEWTDAERVVRPMPVTGALLWNRALWLALGGVSALGAVLRGGRRRSLRATGPSDGVAVVGPLARDAGTSAARMGAAGSIARANANANAIASGAWRGVGASGWYVARWMLRDTGWRVLAALGAVNVGVHAALDAAGARSSAELLQRTIGGLVLHSQLFLILLATIYAGELVWRERDDRSAPLFDALPISDRARVLGSVLGVLMAQAMVVALLTTTAAITALLSSGESFESLSAAGFVDAVFRGVLVPFWGWLLVSLAVHVVVQQKIVGHLCLIAGWVLASLFLGAAVTPGGPRASMTLWVLVGAVSLAVSVVGWARGTRRPSMWRQRREPGPEKRA